MKPIRIAILDMYNNTPNQGMRGIQQILEDQIFPNEWKVYNVRGLNEIPSLDYDIFISTGGSGAPIEDDKLWDKNWLELMNNIWQHNKNNANNKKYIFLICHSFQMLIRHWKLGVVIPRKSTAFGILPIHKTAAGNKDELLIDLPEPFYAVDSRDWQVVQPDKPALKKMGAKLLCIEKVRPHVPLERATMGVRFSDEIVGFQFHPEADEFGTKLHFQRDETKQQIIETHGEKKYNQMLEYLKDSNKIQHTYKTILPLFLISASKKLRNYTLPS